MCTKLRGGNWEDKGNLKRMVVVAAATDSLNVERVAVRSLSNYLKKVDMSFAPRRGILWYIVGIQ